MARLRVGCLQFPVIPGEIEENLRAVQRGIEELAGGGCRLLVLPEMWSSGFDYGGLRNAARETPRVLDLLAGWAVRGSVTVIGSLPEWHDGVVFNTSYVVDGTGGVVGRYRKLHLFGLHGEDRHFGRGDAAVVCRTEWGRIGLMICYDLRFPELARKLALDGADLLCIPAQWPTPRIGHWSLLLRARAIENQLFVIACNACGSDGKLDYGGASAVISPTGAVLTKAGLDAALLTADLELEEITEFRRLIPCFADRVPAVYALDR